jgi:hypothetical protein
MQIEARPSAGSAFDRAHFFGFQNRVQLRAASADIGNAF